MSEATEITAAVDAALALAGELEEYPSSPEAHIARQFRTVIERALGGIL